MKLILICPIILLAGCATASHTDREALLDSPVKCETAELDVSALQSALPSLSERAGSLLHVATPLGALTGIISGQYFNRLNVLTGKTTSEIDRQIAVIDQKCLA